MSRLISTSSAPKRVSSHLRALALCSALLFVCGTAKAELLFNNLSPTNAQTGYSFGAHTSYAQKFSSGSGGAITNISLNLFNSALNPYSGAFAVGIFADTGSGPTASSLFDYFVGDENDLGTLGGSSISLAGNVVGFDTPLAAGTSYWLVVQKENLSTNGSSLSWGGGGNAQGGSGKTYMTLNYGTTWTEILSFPAGFGAEIETSQAVPEPGTWAAAALLVGTAGYVRWRKRAKVS